MRKTLLRCGCTLAACVLSAAAALGQERFAVNSPVRPLQLGDLTGSQAATPDLVALNGSEPFKSGEIQYAQAGALVNRLVPACADGARTAAPAGAQSAVPAGAPPAEECSRVTIIHILRWGRADHGTVAFQRWYVYDPADHSPSFDWTSRQARFQQPYIAGRQAFRLIYIHLNYDLLNPGESIGPDTSGTGIDVLKFPVDYKITIQKQQTQLAHDFQTVLSVLGLGAAPAAVNPVVGYFSAFDFDSAFKTSKIAITASLKQEKKAPAAGTPDAASTTANDLANQTFANEHRAWLGLSAAIPLTSYEDIEYQETNGILEPRTIKRENVYFMVDLYLPPVAPGFTKFRWLPHPIIGLPIKGQPLRHSMAGIGVGLRWAEPFWAAVFNVQDVVDATGKRSGTRTVVRGVWGINISIDAVASALKGGGGGSSSGTSTTTPPKKKGT